ncbi:MAG: glycosyltransferase family 2 protein [Rhodospirillaceae bacterium]|nr:glycosyltransferase family 2 protein [Rhodospirillaceae bacterium]
MPDLAHPSPSAAAPHVAVLLCTYNGGRFLAGQMDSFAAQSHGAWKVWASDDGSSDDTRALLARYAETWGNRLAVHDGPRRGFVANFMSLACNPEIAADYFAYADQDDVWEADKLARAVAWLETQPRSAPALYMSRTRLIGEDDADLGLSPLFTAKAPTFANAMVQNIGGGNTMVFNGAARALLMAHSRNIEIISHDWWTYMLVTGAGGTAFYDPYPGVRYRQHRRQLVGTNAGWPARLWRALLVFGGRFKRWSGVNVAGLAGFRPYLTPDNRRIFDEFCAARTGWLPKRLLSLKRSGVHRQDFVDNIGLYVAALFKRL